MEVAMRILTSHLMLSALVFLLACASLNNGSEAPRISKEEVKAKLGSPNVILLDVRTSNDWDNSGEKIVGALRMNPEKVDAWSGTLAKGKEIILYCS
jgi:hypothetical protein